MTTKTDDPAPPITALELARAIARGDLSAAEAVEAAVARIEAAEPALGAVTDRLFDEARAAVAAGPPPGPLSGVPFLLKQLLAEAAGTVTTAGSRFLASSAPAAADGEIVARYRRAGLVILGKTATSEFGLAPTTESRLYGPTRNPARPGFSAGGSSGGAAAAVAAGLVPAAHATDGGGSIRVPAALTGLFGMKPSRGRVSMAPLGETWAGCGTQHALTLDVRDSAALLDAVAGPAPGDPYAAAPPPGRFLGEVGRPPGRLRIALWADPPGGRSEAAVRAAVEDCARLLGELGHEVEEAAPAFDWPALTAAFATVAAASTRATLVARAAGRPLDPSALEPLTWALAERGARVAATEYIGAVQGLQRAGRQAAPLFGRFDALLSPVLPMAALPLGALPTDTDDAEGWLARLFALVPFTFPWNATGQPAMSVPVARTPDGGPLGVQLVGPAGGEALLFRLAGQLEAARPWRPGSVGGAY